MKRLQLKSAMWAVAILLGAHHAAQAAAENVDRLIHTALMLDARPALGGKVYREACATCHGVRAAGNKSGMPALAGQRLAYLVKQMAEFSERDRDGNTMHRVAGSKTLGEPQTWIDVAAFLNSLPPTAAVGQGDGKNLDLGEGIYREQCSTCHDEDARGDDDGFVPSLRNQHYSYLLRQMRALADGHRSNLDPDLNLFFASIRQDEREAVADFLARLSGPTSNPSQMRANGVTTD